jgi:hypothetical protein
LKFQIENVKGLTNAINNVMLKGKYFTSNGVKSKGLGDYVYLEAKDETLTLYNADETLALLQTVDATIEESGSATLECSKLLAYLKKFSTVTINVDSIVRMTGDGKTASMAIVVEHPHRNMIEPFMNRVKDFSITQSLEELPAWSNKMTFDTKVSLNTDILIDAIDSCEIVGTGVYKLDYGEDLSLSSQDDFGGFNSILETIVSEGEEATVEFTSPIHKFLSKGSVVDILFNDDSPILFLSPDRKLLKAPFVNLLR